MNEERKMILEMVKEGTLSIEEAERLLEALPSESEMNSINRSSTMQPKRILVKVSEGDKAIVNIKVPFSIIKIALKLGQSASAIGAKYLKDSEEAALLEVLKDIDIDEILDSINDGEITLPYTIVDVEDDGEGQRVLVVIE